MPHAQQRRVMSRVLSFVVITVGFAATERAMADTRLTIAIVDAATGEALPARVYLSNVAGEFFLFQSASDKGSALRYDRRLSRDPAFGEHHTTLSAHPAFVDLPPGEYRLEVERGKEYLPAIKNIKVGDEPVNVHIPLVRWVNMAGRGWYSGETHVHRSVDELRNIALAEDLNVTFPLSYWVTESDVAPADSARSATDAPPAELIKLDDTHVIWPRNTEYEIFSVGGKRHTLGAVIILNHRSPLAVGAPPWQPIVNQARGEGALIDIEKFAWPFEAAVPALAPEALYELANNHLWRSGLFFRNWYTPAPPYMQPPFGGTSGNEREWIEFTFGMYYTLLNAGMKSAPTAGSANGVLPTPMGYSRVYVHTPDGFSYENWIEGLKAGRSFVTTGPMLIATANGASPGETFESDEPVKIDLRAEILSQQPIAFSEIVINGIPQRTLRGQAKQTEEGAWRLEVRDTFTIGRTSWFAVRTYEDRAADRVQVAHTAPWRVQIGDDPLKVRREEKRYLVERMSNEIERSRGIVGPEAMLEYERALQRYQQLPVESDDEEVAAQARPPRTDEARDFWLSNMIRHKFTPEEMRLATGMTYEEIAMHVERLKDQSPLDAAGSKGKLTVLPYPGGRHCRIGFLDGAIRPLRDTKLSVFLPWEDAGYVVVDLPEAVFSQLGLMYLAHTHVPTIWDKQGVKLAPHEWTGHDDGSFELSQRLPNGVRIGARATPQSDSLDMELTVHNGTDAPLTEMRAQVCVMLKGAVGFNARTNLNKVIDSPFVAVGSDDGKRWIITAWSPIQRAWGNPPVPCLHSDPLLPDCPPGQTVKATGRLWFYEGTNIHEELKRRQEAQ